MKPEVFILDVDGVMTDGRFYYSSEGKIMKSFGADDADALALLKKYIEIRFISADERGFSISKKRISDDMGYKLDLVSTSNRLNWIKEKYDLMKVIFMGDGILDHFVMKEVAYSIAPDNSDISTKKYANFVTKRSGGHRAVAEASIHVLNKFFQPYSP